jgi:hypothetical protein
MNRNEAFGLISKRIDKDSAHFSNVNTSKEVWWLDVPVSKVTSGVYQTITLVLHDPQKKELHVLEVPAAFLKTNLAKLAIREDKDTVSLELSSDPRRLFESVRPVGSGVRFGQFLSETIHA